MGTEKPEEQQVEDEDPIEEHEVQNPKGPEIVEEDNIWGSSGWRLLRHKLDRYDMRPRSHWSSGGVVVVKTIHSNNDPPFLEQV